MHRSGQECVARHRITAGISGDASLTRPTALVHDLAGHGYVLTPGRYVGAAAVEEDETPFAERFAALQGRLEGQFEEAERLTGVIREKLARASVDGC